MVRYAIGSSGTSIVITPEVLSHFRKHRQSKWYHREAGGQLFAIKEGTQIVIVQATGPRRSDRRTRSSYIPDRQFEVREISEQKKLGRFFVGDWHTHPQRIASPSQLDLRNIQECFRESTHGLNAFVLVIVGFADFPESLFVSVNDEAHSYELAFDSLVDSQTIGLSDSVI